MSNLVPVEAEMRTLTSIAEQALKSGLLPQAIRTKEAAMIIFLKGRELGIPPMQAINSITVVNGRPTLSAELMLSLIYKNIPGSVVNMVKTDTSECVIEAQRPHGKVTTFKFTIKDAELAGLTGKGPWKSYPAAMLRARNISAMARALFPDALSGMVYTPEELGASVDEEGKVRDVAPAPEEPIDPGEFVITIGKVFLGKKLKEVPKSEIAAFCGWIRTKAEANYRLKPSVQEFLSMASRYLEEADGPSPAAVESPPPVFDSFEEFPS